MISTTALRAVSADTWKGLAVAWGIALVGMGVVIAKIHGWVA